MAGELRLPIARWLLPSPLIRWFVPMACNLVLPLVVGLSETFEGSALHERVCADADGFYGALLSRAPALAVGKVGVG